MSLAHGSAAISTTEPHPPYRGAGAKPSPRADRPGQDVKKADGRSLLRTDLRPALPSQRVIEIGNESWRFISDDLRLEGSGDGHENTPRVRRVRFPLVLIHDQFGEVALVVQASESENDAVLGCQEKMDATDAQVT